MTIFLPDSVSLLRKYDVSNIMEQEFGGSSKLLATEIMNYLSTPPSESLTVLKLKYPYTTMKQIFSKYNSIHTSEADVERIFSYAGTIFQIF